MKREERREERRDLRVGVMRTRTRAMTTSGLKWFRRRRSQGNVRKVETWCSASINFIKKVGRRSRGSLPFVPSSEHRGKGRVSRRRNRTTI